MHLPCKNGLTNLQSPKKKRLYALENGTADFFLSVFLSFVNVFSLILFFIPNTRARVNTQIEIGEKISLPTAVLSPPHRKYHTAANITPPANTPIKRNAAIKAKHVCHGKMRCSLNQKPVNRKTKTRSYLARFCRCRQNSLHRYIFFQASRAPVLLC